MFETVRDQFQSELDEIASAGLVKHERVIASAQGAHVTLADGRRLLNLCANNYLGLANHPAVLAAARGALGERGYGMASVRFICGTQDIHRRLEQRISEFLGCEDTILYSSCFDANAGLFETLLGEADAIISDALNHASIIDGVRLCKARRLRYGNRDLDELEAQLRLAREEGAREVVIATDGVFSMDGLIAPLAEICELAERYEALVMVDDCHATGFMGAGGRGTPEHADVMGRVDLLTGTLGKALGGASGGYVAGSREVVELLRQRARPYLFSNALPPAVVGASLRALELAEEQPELRKALWRNTARFRGALRELGLTVLGDEHPIAPVLLEDAQLAARFAERLLDEGVYAVAFSYPVVPRAQARIRTQVSAAHETGQLDAAAAAFGTVAADLGALA
jgi:glycine C-acetyltransferase